MFLTVAKIQHRIQIGAILLLLLVNVGCDRETSNSSNSSLMSDDRIVSIEISSKPTVPLGETQQISAHGLTVLGFNKGPIFATWKSDDPSIATVDANGLVSGVGIGITTLSGEHGTFSATVPIGVVSASPGARALTISGKAYYEDKPFTKDGFTGEKVITPIRQSLLNLIAIDGLVMLSSTSTDEYGSYHFSNINNSSRQGGVYLQLLAKTADNSASPAEIRNNSSDKILLAASGPALDDSLLSYFASDTITVTSSGIGGAFNMLDNFLKGGAFIQKSGFCPTAKETQCQSPFLTAFWEPEGHGGTFFQNIPPAISLCGSGCVGGDADEYDDMVILHEYGHFITDIFSHDNSPGGSHSITETGQDIRLSWSEGWATFYAAAVLNSPIYVDTQQPEGSDSTISINAQMTAVMSYNIESTQQLYTTNEASVSAILWDMLDAPTNDDDPMTTGSFFSIWESFMKIPQTLTSMEGFAFEFMVPNEPVITSFFQTILKGRKIEFFPDAGEAGESSLIVNGSSQHHTLYLAGSTPIGDEDIIPLYLNSGEKYTVQAFNLTNGADTLLAVQNGTDLLTNDNTSALGLGSSITFIANTTTPFVSVKRSLSAPASTGLTGSYDIRLTTP